MTDNEHDLQKALIQAQFELATAQAKVKSLQAKIGQRPASEASHQSPAKPPQLTELSDAIFVALDAFKSNIAVLESDGTIIMVNAAWKQFADENMGKSPTHYVGDNYLSICQAVVGEDAKMATQATEGIRAVIDGETDDYFLEYPCHSPTQKRWFQMRVLPLSAILPRQVIIIHSDITEKSLMRRELISLYEATSYLFKADNINQLGQQIVEAVVKEFQQADCGLLLINRDENRIIRLARTGAYAVQSQTALDLDGDGLVPLAVRNEQMIYEPDVTLSKTYIANEARTRSELVVPLRDAKGVIAVLDLQHPEVNAFTQRDQRLIATYAERAAAAIENALLYQEINRHAHDLEQHVQERTVELRRSKEQVEAIVNNSADGILLLGDDLRIREANRAFERLFASSKEESIGRSIIDFICLDWSAELEALTRLQTSLQESTPFVEICAQRADGSNFPAELAIRTTASGEIVCTVRDITESKQIQEALAEERNLLRTLIDNLPDEVFLKDRQHRFVLSNKRHTQKRGFESEEELIGKTDLELYSSSLAQQFHDGEDEIFRTGEPLADVEIETTLDDGSPHWVLGSKHPLRNRKGDMTGLVGIVRDITARKEMEESLRQKVVEETAFQEKLKALHEISIELTTIETLDTFYKQVVELGREQLGFERIALLLYDEDQHAAIGTYGTDTDGNTSDEHHLYFTPAEDGLLLKALHQNERFAQANHVPLHTAHNPSGTGWKAVGVIWNGPDSLGWLAIDNGLNHEPPRPYLTDLLALYCITVGALLARKREQIALQESEALYRLLANNVSDVVVRTDELGEYTYVSPSSKSTLGYKPEEMVGRMALSFVHPDDVLSVRAARSQSLAKRQETTRIINRFEHKDGHYLWLEIVGRNVADEETGKHVGFIGMLRDIGDRKQAQDALERSSAEYQDLYNNAPCGYHSLDENGLFVQINDTELRWLGYEREEVIGKLAFADIITPESLAIFQHNFPAFKKQGRINDLEFDLICKDGSPMHVLLSATAIYDENGNYLQSRSTIYDMTELKLARDALEAQFDFLQRIIDSIPTHIAVKDAEGRYEVVNKAVAEMWGLTPQKMVGQRDDEIVNDPDLIKNFRKDEADVLRTGEPIFAPAEKISGRYFQTNKIPLQNGDGEFEKLLIVATDITERQRAEERLEVALQKEKELNELKSRFVSMASHEFRTPLATILATVETLKAYRHQLTDDNIAYKLEKVHEQVEHLEDIMDDVLQLARMQARRVVFTPARLNIDALCRSVLHEFESHLGQGYDVTYRCDPSLGDVMMDKKLMRQIINNLVSNAIKYTKNGKFSVDLAREDGSLVLRVSDQGIGIPEADLAHLFEPFHRASNVGTIAGTGLGLVITKEAVELHKGTIVVESQVNVGTTFTVTIPL